MGVAKMRKQKVDARKRRAQYFFDYNTVESTLLGCGVLVNLAGVMLSSSTAEDSFYHTQIEFITWIAIMVIVLSLTYYFCVCVAEISAGTQFMACVQRKLCC